MGSLKIAFKRVDVRISFRCDIAEEGYSCMLSTKLRYGKVLLQLYELLGLPMTIRLEEHEIWECN
jgi:hypothetical protein